LRQHRLAELEAGHRLPVLNQRTWYDYEITPRAPELGGGWQLRLLEDGAEVGRSVFPAAPGEVELIEWWTSLSETERLAWLQRAAHRTRSDAYLAHLQDEAWQDATEEAIKWLDSRLRNQRKL
jgi:hypothetical protein